MKSISKILIIDYGSQLTQLIAKRVRFFHFYSEIYPFDYSFEQLDLNAYCGIIFSGGPYTSTEDKAPYIPEIFFKLSVPLLGICYGAQRTIFQMQGKVEASLKREYGQTHLRLIEKSQLFKDFPSDSMVLMSHSDHILEVSSEFKVIALSENNIIAAIEHQKNPWFLVQFHPEAQHTENGDILFRNFLQLCHSQPNWIMEDFINTQITDIRQKIGQQRVLLALSGGVDSMVTSALLDKAIGNQLECVFVNHGLLRKTEQQEVIEYIQHHFSFKLHVVEAQDRFLEALEGIYDPESKRKIIGELFIKEFENLAKNSSIPFDYLAQGTIYPDVIESAGNQYSKGQVIKSHHNVGGLPEKMLLKIIEPLKMLFKDEVRRIGEILGLPHSLIYRHPFPGPGLGIRILGEIKKEYLDILQNADEIFINELKKANLYHQVQQAFCVFLPVKSVGVMGDNRTYEYTIAIRAIETQDFMTSKFAHLPFEFLDKVATQMINKVHNVNRVVYDISNKPPSTIEWE